MTLAVALVWCFRDRHVRKPRLNLLKKEGIRVTSPREERPCMGDRAPERRLTVTGHWKRLLMGSPRPPVIVVINLKTSTCNSHITGKFEGVFFSVGMGDGATTPSLVAFIFMKLHYPSPFPADNGPTFGSSEELEPRAKRMGRCDFLSSVLRVRVRCCDAAEWVDSREPSHYFFLNHFFYKGYQ